MADEQVTGMNYFDHQFLRTGDFETAQQYHVDRLRQHNSLLHGAGIVEGLTVEPTGPRSVVVKLGRALDQAHREVVLRQTKAPAPEHPTAVPEAPTLLLVQTSTEFQETEVHITGEALPILLDQVPASSEPGNPVFITIRQQIKATTPSTDPGITGNTRLVERAVIEASTTPPAGERLLLARINRNSDGTIEGRPVRTDLRQATARLADDSVTSAKIAQAVPGRTDQDTNTGEGIKTGHIQDRAVTGDKIENGAIQESHLSQSLLDRLNLGRQWVVLPFFPKRLGTGTTPAFILDTNHSKSTGEAFGVMEIPIPAGARQITQLRIAGTENGGVITIHLFRAGINDQSTTDLLERDNEIRVTPFDQSFPINDSLDGTSQGLALHVHASANSDIWLVAAEFAFRDDSPRTRIRGRRRGR